MEVGSDLTPKETNFFKKKKKNHALIGKAALGLKHSSEKTESFSSSFHNSLSFSEGPWNHPLV